MNEKQRYEIACLAEDAYTKNERVKCLRMMNTPADPEERRKSAIELALAEVEAWEADRALNIVKVNIVYGFK